MNALRLCVRGLRQVRPVDLAWVAFTGAMLVVMTHSRQGMTIPYHFLFVSFALVYGFRLWPRPVAITLLLAITASTGLVFAQAYLLGDISGDELAEIPLMPLIVAFMVWHGLRGVAARREVEELAAREAGRLDRQREFLRDASHAIRTPVTIARGYVQVMQLAVDPTERPTVAAARVAADTQEILHQLDRINQLAGRLLTIEQLETTPALEQRPVDVQALVAQAGRRWSTAVPRRWSVDAVPSGIALADEHRLDEALDALVENALRFTTPGDTVRISAHRAGGWAVIEVADSGPGIPPRHRDRVFDRFFHRHPRGEEPGSGLGLALVQAVAVAHAGDVVALEAPEGGALVRLRLPLTEVTATASPAPAPAAVPPLATVAGEVSRLEEASLRSG